MAKSISLQNFLKDADERVKEAAAKALNESAEKLEAQIKANMDKQGIKIGEGNLLASLKATKATPKNLKILIKSEVYAPVPKNPGSRNPRMKGRYKYGVPYGRILEFSPHYEKPFFYTAWYKMRNDIKDEVMEKIGNAWSGSR